MKQVGSKKRQTDLTNTDAFPKTYPKLSTHNLSFTQKPFEVVFLDVHEAGDVWDVKAVVLHVLCLQVYLVTWNKNLLISRKCHSTRQTTDYREPSDRDTNTWILGLYCRTSTAENGECRLWIPCGAFPAAEELQENSSHRTWARAPSCLLLA